MTDSLASMLAPHRVRRACDCASKKRLLEVVAGLVTVERPIDFAAIDDRPVDIVFALVVPEEAAEAHLQLLARLAGLFSDHAFCARLRACRDAAQMHHCLGAAWEHGAAAP